VAIGEMLLFAIIALGEGVIGTAAAVSAVVGTQGWTMDAALVSIAGIGLTFGMWWVYYLLPSASVLHAHRDRSFVWGYGQIVVIAAIVATGAGLHVAAYFIEHKSHAGALATLLCTAIPVAVFLGAIYALHAHSCGGSTPSTAGCWRRPRPSWAAQSSPSVSASTCRSA
jgi:low temperature requirement protein LtrA